MTLAIGAMAQSSAIGVVKVNGKGEWNLYSVQQITSDDKIVVQYPGKADRSDCCVAVTLDGGKRKQTDVVVVTDEYGDRDVWNYKLKSPSVSIKRPFVGIAIIDKFAHANARVHGVGSNLVHVEDDGKELIVNSCLGTEGVHVLARDGKKMSAHLYFNLGYSVKATCTDDMLE
jgi:hypothetical protein